jgi:flagellar biosynthesis/type III secretory pathway protein FliH
MSVIFVAETLMKEIEVAFPEFVRNVVILDPKDGTSVVTAADEARASREAVRAGGAAGQLDELREQLDELRHQLERQKKTPDPVLSAQLQQKQQELTVEIEQTKATRQTLEATLRSLSQAVAAIRQEPERLKLELQDSVIQLATLIAQRFVKAKITADDYPVDEIVGKLIERLNTDKPVTVRLHPQDLALLRSTLSEEPLIKDGPEIIWEEDSTLTRGNIHAGTGEMSVSHIVREQLQMVTEQLREAACWD